MIFWTSFLVHSKVHWSHADIPVRLSWGRLGQGKPAWGRLAMLLWALLLFHVGQVADYLLNVISNFCSSNSAHAAIAVLLAVNCRLARWKLSSLLLPEPANSQNKDSRTVIPSLFTPVLTPAHIHGAHLTAAQGTAAVCFSQLCNTWGAQPLCSPKEKVFLTKQIQPSHACDHRESTASTLCCSLPQLCLSLERQHQVRSQEQSNHNKGIKGRVQGKTRVANLKETTKIKISSVWMSVSKEHSTTLYRGTTYCLNGSRRRCWTLWTRHMRD